MFFFVFFLQCVCVLEGPAVYTKDPDSVILMQKTDSMNQVSNSG